MDALTKIIEEAVDDTVSVASILRKALVLAHQLHNDRLKDWVSGELNGYPNRELLPDYRSLPVVAVGTFLGPFGSQLNDHPLPAAMMKKGFRDWASRTYMMQPIASLESLINGATTGEIHVPWPAEVVILHQTTFLQDKSFALNRAHQRISKPAILGIVENVRNKLLALALELQREVGEAEPSPQNPPPAIVEQTVVNTIFGGQTIVFGNLNGDVSQGSGNTILKGDFTALSKHLTEIGVPSEELPALQAAIEADQTEEGPQTLGTRAKAWITKAASGTGKAALKIGQDVATKVITEAVGRYIGV